MGNIYSLQDGFDCVAEKTSGGWFIGAVAVSDADREHLSKLERFGVVFGKGRAEPEWKKAVQEAGRDVILVTGRDTAVEEKVLWQGERVTSLSTVSSGEPLLAWTGKKDGNWRLMLGGEEGLREVCRSDIPLGECSLAVVDGNTYAACHRRRESGVEILLYREDGRTILTIPGGRPRLASDGKGALYLVSEESADGCVRLMLHCIIDGTIVRSLTVPGGDDLNLNAEAVCRPSDGVLHVVWESSPRWGVDERVGLHRRLQMAVLASETADFAPAGGGYTVPVPQEAFLDGSVQNFTPIRPQVVLLGNRPAVAYRWFRFVGQKSFGWDTCLVTCEGEGWTEPVRISEAPSSPDSRYSVIADGSDLYCFLPCGDRVSNRTFEEELEGKSGRSTQPVWNHRIEVRRCPLGEVLPEVGFPGEKSFPVISVDTAADPPSLENTGDLSLVWGDLHAHSAYSKCMSANDGTPEEVLRFQRDVLKCRVLCLTEHVEYMTHPEFTHVLDAVEEAAGDICIPLYGVEWAKRPAHHTNFFAVDRGVFDQLRALMLVCDNLPGLYARIKRELPENSVTAVRHMHGMNVDEFGVSGARVTETHDPEVEWAMEGMQTRGNMMVDSVSGRPLFPNNFLDAGARVGIVGGSDHSRGTGSNRFCLTGFWVSEMSPASILGAIKARKTLGASNGKIGLWPECGGVPMGESISVAGTVSIQCRISSSMQVKRVCLMRDGRLLPWTVVQAVRKEVELTDDAAEPGEHWYCVTVEGDSHLNKPSTLVHSSPFFIKVEG